MKNLLVAVIGVLCFAVGCGNFENKAEKVLGLDDVSMREAMGDLAALGKLSESLVNLSMADMLAVERVSTALQKKLEAEWIPELEKHAKQLGIRHFAVSFEDDGGVVVVPDGSKYSGFVTGSADADEDRTEFIFRIEASIKDGELSWQFKR